VNRIGWLALLLTAVIASLAGAEAQLMFALAVGLGLGLLHGVSDMHLVTPARRPAFLCSYLAAALGGLLCWQIASATTLVFFLVLSAWHFFHEDELFHDRLTSLALGLFIISGPAVVHEAEVARLLGLAIGSEESHAWAERLTWLLAAGGIVALPVLLLVSCRQRCLWLATTLVAVVLLPPLAGFAVGFYVLHAAPQTRVRQRLLRAAHLAAYLRLTWPILVGAALFTLVGGFVFLLQEGTGIRALFVVLTAFAVPHMIVLPRFRPAGLSSQPSSATRLVER
jgi:Brp/Blh family beta-carotene 15,15'-monooxygenase